MKFSALAVDLKLINQIFSSMEAWKVRKESQDKKVI
jgi:hypothetical protein